MDNFTEVNILQEQNQDEKGQTTSGENEDREMEEILYPDLFELRRKGTSILSTIEELYENSGYEYLLKQYTRECQLRHNNKLNQSTTVSKYAMNS